MYKVLKTFADLQDGKYLYHEGDKYPRDNVIISEARIAELSTNNNALREPLIVKVEEPKTQPKVEKVEEQAVETTDDVVEIKPTRKKARKKNNDDDN